VIQPVLHLHVCADPTPIELATVGADYAANSTVEPLHSIADYAADSTAEPLHSVAYYAADSAAAGAAPTETS
jgi:hypothetical protein